MSPGGWHYIYLGPGATIGGNPDPVISVKAPDDSVTSFGTHPDDGSYRFLSTMYVEGGGGIRSFAKSGAWVTMGRGFDISSASAFASPSGSYQVVTLSSLLPASWVTAVRVRLVFLCAAGLGTGDEVPVKVRGVGYSSDGHTLRGLKAGSTGNAWVEFEMPLFSGEDFEILWTSTDFQSIVSAEVVAYAEGRHSTGVGLGA